MKTFLVILVVLGLLTSGLAGCAGSETPATTAPAGPATTDGGGGVTTAASAPETTVAPKGEVGTRTNPVPFGAAAKVGDWTVKVTHYVPDATQLVLDTNEFNDPPEAGQQYVLVTVEATYSGDQSGTFWVDVTYKFLGSGGNTFDSGTTFAVAPKPIIDAGEAFPGASVSGDLLFAVDSDQVTGGMLILQASFSFDEPVFFALQ